MNFEMTTLIEEFGSINLASEGLYVEENPICCRKEKATYIPTTSLLYTTAALP